MKETESVVLVDKDGHDILEAPGRVKTAGKMEAHRKGLLHRAVSVFIFNDKDQVLLQKRASDKYHSPDRWTNTCCTHPRVGESPLETARRRLREEMGLECELNEAFTFQYKASVGKGLIENEFDHVFFGVSNRVPTPNKAEVSNCKWMSARQLERELDRHPGDYSPWLLRCYGEVAKRRPGRMFAPSVG